MEKDNSSDVSLSERAGSAAPSSTKREESTTENDFFNSETIMVPQNNDFTMQDDFADFQEAVEENDDTCVLEQTIATMEESHLCFHPVHHHSFSPVSILLSGSMRKCVGCEQRLKAVLGVSSVVHDQVVRCVSCGAYAHRSCAMDTPSRPKDFALMWSTKCPVNTVIIQGSNKMENDDNLQGSPMVGEEDGDDNSGILIPTLDENNENHENDKGDVQQASSPHPSFFQFLSPSNLLFTGSQRHAADSDEEAPKEQSISSDEEEEFLLWTSEGPPRHWASEQALSGIHRSNTSTEAAENDDNDEEENANTPLHVANNTFATVSKAIQENIVAHFIRRPFIEKVISLDSQDNVQNGDLQSAPKSPAQNTVASSCETLHTADSPVSRVQVEALLTEVEPSSPKRGSIARMASGTMEVAKTSANMRKKMGIVSVAGGIAGGVAGLVMAGPAGAVIGAKCGQTAGLLGVLIEGSMTVGVFVAGVAAGSLTAQHIQQQQEKRVLTIGEDGVKQKLLLVRPNIAIDPVWNDLCLEARMSHSSSSKVFGILPSSKGSMSKKERYKRDSDIVETDESEIPTADKVLLLVSRSLNDKEGLPGHVYRCLIQNYRDRSTERGKMTIEDGIEEDVQTPDVDGIVVDDTDHDDTDPLVGDAPDDTPRESDPCKSNRRARRQDTHAVIKHVTATLLEVRPGFASSPAITEMSATAVESLVFGELYDNVFEEIVEETQECDTALMNKIRAFDKSHEAFPVNNNGGTSTDYPSDLISQPAIDSLSLLPEAHSTADKLRYCVEFLELISVHFTQLTAKSSGKQSCLSADSLLKMVCQHIIAAKVPNMNAEILFLEEFARDEQLLRGKEGYALVTLQASLHFLNTSTDFDTDIFGQDEE